MLSYKIRMVEKMKLTQKDTNQYKNSDSNKRYYTYDYYLKKNFGSKVAKLPIDCNFTCPNIDGNKGFGGCIYCSDKGSGDFALGQFCSVTKQCDAAMQMLKGKWKTNMSIPYFQAHTNTYADTELLRSLYYEALNYPGAVGLNIATRADCLTDETVELLSELAEKTHLTVELGLQTIHDTTAELINRCHTFEDFTNGYFKLREKNKKIKICIHLIHGLPGETREMMLQTSKTVAALLPDQVKIHCLCIIKNTSLCRMYKMGMYAPITKDDYVNYVCDTLEVLHPDTVIGRLTGDVSRDMLEAPMWTVKKTEVINDIDKEMYRRGTYQGSKYVLE